MEKVREEQVFTPRSDLVGRISGREVAIRQLAKNKKRPLNINERSARVLQL